MKENVSMKFNAIIPDCRLVLKFYYVVFFVTTMFNYVVSFILLF